MACFNYNSIFYLTENIKLNVGDLHTITQKLFNVNIDSQSFNHIKESLIMEKIDINPVSLNIKHVNIDCFAERFKEDNLSPNDRILYNSLELNVYPCNFKIVPLIKSDDNCSICLDKIENDNIGKLDCVHTFCYSCLIKLNNSHNKCPMCRNDYNNITNALFYYLQNEKSLNLTQNEINSILKTNNKIQ